MHESNFNFEKKKNIFNDIQKIKDKNVYIQLFNLINKDYKKYTINKNGIFVNLNNLENITLSKIRDFLNDFISDNDSFFSDTDSSISNIINDNDYTNFNNDNNDFSDDDSDDDFNIKEIKLTVKDKNIFIK